MKIIELKCKACNGTLEIDENNPNRAVCQYCQTVYRLDEEKSEAQQRSERWYTPIEEKRTSSVGEYINWKRGIIASVLVLIFIVVSRWDGLVARFNASKEVEKVTINQNLESQKVAEESVQSQVQVTLNSESFQGVFAQMAVTVLQKSQSEMQVEDLTCFKWIKMKYTQDSILVGYSFEVSENANDEALEWMTFQRDTSGQDFKALAQFTGLKKLEVAGMLSKQDVEGLSLEALSCYAHSPLEIAEIVDATQIKELNISAGLERLEGLSQFENLEKFSFNGYEVTDIKELVSLKHLKSLTIESGDGIRDFSVLGLMTGLEALSIESENVRDIHFVDKLTQLKAFELIDAPVLQINSVGQLSSLTTLKIEDCDALKDLNTLKNMTQLKKLTLEVPYQCEAPDLSGLDRLEYLEISGIKQMDFLKYMTALQELTIDCCKITNTDLFSGLQALKKLKCSSLTGELSNWGFVTKIPGLEILDLNGVTTYEDISCVFNVPTLEKLFLNGVECEINFNQIKENSHLKVLEMNGVKLYKNVDIRGSNGFYAIDYDTVSMDEHKGFIQRFPGLNHLALADNTLTDLEFARTLHELKTLDISDNYITSLKPLQALGKLQNINCTNNPIENDRVLNEQVIIVQ